MPPFSLLWQVVKNVCIVQQNAVVATVAAPGRIVVVVSVPEYARQCAKLSALPAKKERRKNTGKKRISTGRGPVPGRRLSCDVNFNFHML